MDTLEETNLISYGKLQKYLIEHSKEYYFIEF